ncbi:hypothetical protein ACFVZW_11560 [Streptomyces sp. NPDC059567]|uniref:hypothetical protein n=1 Tax=Streptomyces sp. NPDC059567 TaxID=3346867 RepID=UPI00367AF2E7
MRAPVRAPARPDGTLCALVLRGPPSVPAAPAATGGEPRLAVLRDRPYALLTFLNALLLLRLPLLGGIFLAASAATKPAVRWARKARAQAEATGAATELGGAR